MKALAARSAAVVAALLLLFISPPVQAQGVDEFGGYGGKGRVKQSESPQDMAVELRFGRYLPEVDSELGGATPFHDTFGDANRYLLGFEVDWQLVRIPHFGSLAPAFGWNITRFAAKAPFTDGNGLSATYTRLWMMPMYVVGVARVDVFARDFNIPLVPYAKFGFGYGWWWSSDGDDSAKVDGKAGKGASYGLTWALGGMFLLDILDADDAVTADGMTGINNSYIFMEWFRPKLDGFGNSQVMDIGSSSWVAGVAIEM